MCRIAARLGGRLTFDQVERLVKSFGGSVESTLGGNGVSIQVPDSVKDAVTRVLATNGAQFTEQHA